MRWPRRILGCRRARGGRERGSSIAELAMVIVLLMTLFLALVGLGLWAYTHSLLTNAAGQSARYAANADIPTDEAVSNRATEIMAQSLVGSAAAHIRCDLPPSSIAGTIAVHCAMPAPGLIPLLGSILPDVEVTAHALRETP